MVQTITPVVHGGRRSRWGASLALHALGATLSAGALGGALGAVGLALGAPWGRTGLVLVGAVAAVYAAREVFGLAVPIPELRRQVPEWWRSSFSAPVASFLYGVGLGVGFATHLRYGTLVAVGAGAMASGDPLLGAVLMAPFGFARAATVAASGPATSAERLAAATERLERWAMGWIPRAANVAALVAVVAAAAWTAAPAAAAGTSGVAPALVAAVLGWAAVAKVVRFGAWRATLPTYGIPVNVAWIVAVAVPLVEAATVGLFVIDVRIGGAAALILLASFSAALVRARAIAGPRLRCGCFGRGASRNVGLLLARNAALIALSALALVQPPAALPELGVPRGADVLPAILAAIGIALVAVTAGLAWRAVAAARAGPPTR